MKNVFSFLFFLFSTSIFALEHAPHQGGIAVIELGKFSYKPKLFYKSKEAKVLKKEGKYLGVIGIGVDEKVGERHLVAVTQHQKKDYYFTIQKKVYPKEFITLTTNKHVTPVKKDLSRHYKEKRKAKNLIASFNKSLETNLDFVAPLTGRISSPYGQKRYYNKKPRSPHKGIDIAAPKGTPIRAAESGHVSICEPFFFNGNTIYLDHGEGVITMYCHMQDFAVKTGDFVNKGDLIGYVGSTGRSTGPHLHFSLILNQQSVDPALFIQEYYIAKP
ncbi:MAG: peptidoglycan DD-metalloendopeptidase family protein [Epsilonproteobacteria bacterium]|nr:peptidoglycan DD-metalloendopeptidase family protein [Campylobacterota bacterium]